MSTSTQILTFKPWLTGHPEPLMNSTHLLLVTLSVLASKDICTFYLLPLWSAHVAGMNSVPRNSFAYSTMPRI